MSDKFNALRKEYSNSVLVSTPTGTLLRLYAPITAKAVRDSDGYTKGQRLRISAVFESKEHILFYVIDGKMCNYSNYQLLN